MILTYRKSVLFSREKYSFFHHLSQYKYEEKLFVRFIKIYTNCPKLKPTAQSPYTLTIISRKKLEKIQNDCCVCHVSYSMCILQRLPGLVSQNRKSGNLHANQYHCTLPAGQRKARQKLDYIHFLWLDNIKTCAKHMHYMFFFHIVSRVWNGLFAIEILKWTKNFSDGST